MVDDKITYQDFLDAVAMLEAAGPPKAPPMIIWPNPNSLSLFPDLLWVVWVEEKPSTRAGMNPVERLMADAEEKK